MKSRPTLTPVFVTVAALVALASIAGVEPPVGVQVVGLAIVVALVGLPHGALDPVIAHDAGLVDGVSSLGRYLVGYVVLAAATTGMWLAVPALALPAFFVVSALHFGGDWSAIPSIGRAAGGAAVVLSPLWFQPDESASLLEPLADETTADLMISAAGILAPAAVLVAITLGLRSGDRSVPAEIGAIVALAAIAPPLIAFGTYFCALHSPRHIGAVIDRSRIERRTAVATAAVFTVLTVGLAAIAWPLIESTADTDDAVIRLVIVGLAALTVPHMTTIERARRRSAVSVAVDTNSLTPDRSAI
ncbi:MAG: Brp/Blh family beta-carotene 15,15'-dioxygenase [Actinomycetota bacterium]